MTNRNLKHQETAKSCSLWLNQNLNKTIIIPTPKNIPLLLTDKKGIYFWFMHPDGYKKLSNHIKIKPLDNRFEKTIEGVKYHLVYLGTAGVRNNSNGINNSHLRERIEWHILINKEESHLCNVTMSTFRRTVGPLISDDLIEVDTQNKIDGIFEKYFKIFFIVYPGSFLDVKDVVNSDEGILIDKFRPLFNLDKNDNARELDHITSKIQTRRNLVEKSTKIRLGCNKTKTPKAKNEKSPKTKRARNKTNKKNSEVAISFIGKNCTEFNVLQNQNIHKVINARNDLPKGECWILLFNSAKPSQLVYASKRKDGWRKTGGIGIQNIFKFFDNSDKKIKKWKIVQNEMKEKKIKEITVRVCVSIDNTKGNTITPIKEPKPKKPSPKKLSTQVIVPNLKSKSHKHCFLVPCSNKKEPSLNQIPKGRRKLSFDDELGKYRKDLIKRLENCTRHVRKKEILDKQIINLEKGLSAHKLYSLGKLFNEAESNTWIEAKAEKVYVISALFGIIKSTDYIPTYDLAMNDILFKGDSETSPSKFWKGKLDSVIEKLIKDGFIIYDLLSDEYRVVLNESNRLEKLTNKWTDSYGYHRGRWLKENL